MHVNTNETKMYIKLVARNNVESWNIGKQEDRPNGPKVLQNLTFMHLKL